MTSAADIWKHIRRYCSSRTNKFLHDCRHWRDAEWLASSNNIFQVIRATKRFVKNQLPGILELPTGAPVRMELPLSGTRSLTLIVEAGSQKVVLRVYPASRKPAADAHVQGAQLLASHDLNVPRVLYFSEKPAREDIFFIVEEFLEGTGKRGKEISSCELDSLATQLSRMHSVHNSGWGRIGMEREVPFFPSVIQRIKRDLQELRQGNIVNKEFVERVSEWVERWKPLFSSTTRYSLTHNDLQPANGIFTESGEFYLVDLGRLQWGPAAREVVRCYHRQLRQDPELIAAFNEMYFSKLNPADANATRHFCRFYEVFHRISTLAKMNVKNVKVPEVRERNAERQRVMLDELNQLLDEDVPKAL